LRVGNRRTAIEELAQRAPAPIAARSRTRRVLGAAAWLLLVAGAAQCRKATGPIAFRGDTTLRVGVGSVALSSPQAGLNQVVNLLSLEGLVNLTDDGRPRPWLAQSLSPGDGGRSLVVQLRPGLKFHDGSSVTAPIVVDVLERTLPKVMGPAFEDVERINALDDTQVEIGFRRPSPFVLESLETPIERPGVVRVGTGPFMRAPSAPAENQAIEMRANGSYYLGRPALDRININPYPNVRAAWAEILRDHLDVLFEVGGDALDSLQSSTKISTFTFTRPYQYIVILNTRLGTLHSSQIRRALNLAVDRPSLVRDGLFGHGIPSAGPVTPRHWAFDASIPTFTYEPQRAAETIRKEVPSPKAGSVDLQITCLTPPDVSYERLALALKRQLAAVGVDLSIREASMDQIGEAFARRDFEAVLIDVISGPSLFRTYRWWHSHGAQNVGFASARVDAALDRIRHAANDEGYRLGVSAFEQAIADDPPAIFLAWGERARAVSNRFSVAVEPGRDIISTIRLWRPATEGSVASRN